jgi:hypothetical protein
MLTRRIGDRDVSAIGLGGMPLSRIVPIPGASRPESEADSADAVDLVLGDEDLARLDAR